MLLSPSKDRVPTWSAGLTTRLAARIPRRWFAASLTIIKTVHTAAFFSIAGSIVLFAWDGFRGRRRRRTGIAGAVAVAETLIYVSNNRVCPLTTLAGHLGARRGFVADTFLPNWLSRRIPVLSGALLTIGLVLNMRNALAG